MDKELTDRTWSCLPKEFKEEVKKEWQTANNEERLLHDAFMRGCYSTMVLLFGRHNLTSDAEGEEVLTVKASVVKDIYDSMNKAHPKENAWVVKQTLEALFGSKCLPDEKEFAENANCKELKPAKPKFKVGDRVRIKDGYYKEELHGCIGIIRKIDGCHIYVEIDSTIYPATMHSIEPYTEPKETCTDDCKSQCKSQEFDAILKDHFRDHNRLHIAAMAMQGILSNIDLFKNVLETGMETLDGDGISYRAVAKASFLFADALIAEAEKGGEE